MIMIRFLGIGMDCISSMLMLAPAALLILKLSGRRLKNKHMFFLLLYLCVLTGIYSVTGIPDIKDCSFDFTLNLIPLVDVLSSPDQYLLNILMFLPVGFLLPLLWDEYQDFRHLMGFCCFLTVFIEVSQVFTFRTTDVDDLLTNLLGAALGYALIHLPAKRWNIRLPLNIDNDYEEKHGQWVYLLVLFLQQFFVQPYWSAFFWDTVL